MMHMAGCQLELYCDSEFFSWWASSLLCNFILVVPWVIFLAKSPFFLLCAFQSDCENPLCFALLCFKVWLQLHHIHFSFKLHVHGTII